MRRATETPKPDLAKQNRDAGFAAVRAHPLFGPLLRRAAPHTIDTWGIRATALKRGGLLAIDARGGLVYDARATTEVCDWVWSIAHVLTHLGFGHADADHLDGRGSYTPEWRAACCVAVDRFLGALHLPGAKAPPPGFEGEEERLAQRFARSGVPPILAARGPAGGGPDLWEDLFGGLRPRPAASPSTWGRTFAVGLAALEGVEVAPVAASAVGAAAGDRQVRAIGPAPTPVRLPELAGRGGRAAWPPSPSLRAQ